MNEKPTIAELQRMVLLAVVCGLVTFFWWFLPEVMPQWTWAIDKAMSCVSLGILSALFVWQFVGKKRGT